MYHIVCIERKELDSFILHVLFFSLISSSILPFFFSSSFFLPFQMDQRAALHFVKRRIESFGGNPNSITLFGESAGAVMIGLHLQMQNDGLFHKAILQSNPMGYQFRSVVVADFLGDALRRTVDCRDLECMRTEAVEEIMRAQSSLMGKSSYFVVSYHIVMSRANAFP
jgi:carboxylesterase type B